MPEHTAKSEREKYRRMWSRPDYRSHSPGLTAAPDAHERLGMYPHASLIDYGCGEGRALDWFREHGIEAAGVDLVALRPDVIEASLWALPPDLGPSDFAFCADVLEHLPEECVLPSLAAIAARTKVAGYLTVATVPCKVGRRFGEELHLTVRPREWWEAAFDGALWSDVRCTVGEPEWRLIFEARP